MAFSFFILIIGALLHQAICHPSFAERRTNLPVRDSDASIEDAPFVAGIFFEKSFVCAGAIIDEQYILASANCFSRNGTFQVTVGSDKVYINVGEVFEIEDIIVHPNFDEETYDFDISVIKLSKPLSFSSKVKKIELAKAELEIDIGAELTISGRYYEICDKNETNRAPPVFKQVELPKFSDSTCQNFCFGSNPPLALSRMICTEYYDHVPSSLDSGNPLTYDGQLVGITSFDAPCNQNVAVYTSISAVVCWIKEIIHPE